MLLDIGDDPNWINWLANIMSARAVDGCIVYAADPVPSRDVQRLGANVVLVEAHASHAAQHRARHLRRCPSGDGAPREPRPSPHRPPACQLRPGDLPLRGAAPTSPAIDEAGLPLDPQAQVTSRFDIESSSRAAGQLLDIEHRPTAILCDDDLLAAGAYKAAVERGLKVGRDVSIVGFDDIELARMLEPALTTVEIPAARIGADAVAMAIDLIEGGEPRTESIDLRLIVRESSGIAPETR